VQRRVPVRLRHRAAGRVRQAGHPGARHVQHVHRRQRPGQLLQPRVLPPLRPGMKTDDRPSAPRTARLCDLPRTPGYWPGSPNPAALLGRWVNYDPGTTGIAELWAWQRAGVVVVYATSLVAGRRTGWGEARADVFAGAVDSTEAAGFTARYDLGDM